MEIRTKWDWVKKCISMFLAMTLIIPALSGYAATNDTYEQKGEEVHYNWGYGAPSGVKNDNFTAKFDQSRTLNAGDYFVQALADDRVRVAFDGKNVIDRWNDAGGQIDRTLITNVKQGDHKIQTDYYENTGQAAIFSDIVPFDSWLAYYYPNTNLDGYPVDAKVIAPQGDEKSLVENNGEGSPTPKVPTNNFSARYTTVKRLPAGEYIIRGKADDGMRVFIDGKLVIDEWDSGKWDKEHAKKITIQDNTAAWAFGSANEKDTHLVEVQYLELGGGSNVQFNIQPYGKAIQSNTWIAEYYNNKELKGDAIVVAGKNSQNKIENIDFDWKDGSPSASIPNDNFSARYTKYDEFSQGDYIFEAKTDDGIRVYVDNVKVMDSWTGSAGETRKATVPMTAGTHKVVIEYLELSGNALIQAHYYKNKESQTNNNIIGNGDFESDIEKQLWEKTLNAGAQLSKDTNEKPPGEPGASSIRVDVSKGENSIASSKLVEYKQRVKVSPNQTYSMSIWSKTKGENISRNIDLTFFKDESNWINDALTMPTYTINSKEDWSKSEYVFTTSPTTNFIEVKIRIGRNLLGISKGSVWFDSANLKAIQPNMVGQTTKFNNWKVDTSTPGTVGNTLIDTKTVTSDDKQSYKVEVPKGTSSFGKALPNLVQRIPVESNQFYKLDTLIKGVGNNLNSIIYISLLDEQNQRIADANRTYDKNIYNITDWKQYGSFFKTSSTTKYVEITLMPMWDFNAETSGNIWVGSVLLSKIDYKDTNSNNLLNDSDFEKDDAVSNWKFSKFDEKGSIAQSKNEKSPESKGGNSLLLKLSQSEWYGNFIDAYQEISVEPLKTYKFSIWAKTTNSKGIKPQVDLQFKDSEGNNVTDALQTKTIDFTLQDKWEKKEFTFKTSLLTKKMLVKLSATRQLATTDSYGTILFDSANLTPINGSQINYSDIKLTGTNLVSNNSFESNITDNWKSEPYNDLSTLSQDKTIHAPTSTGNSSLKVDVKPKINDYGNVILKQSVKVKPNQSYVFDSWIKSENLSNAVVRINVVLNGENAPVSEKYIYKAIHVSEKSSTDWFNKRLIFKTSEQITEAEIIIQISYPNDKASGKVWIDNLSLVENNQVGVCDYSPYGGMTPFSPDKSWDQTMAELERIPKELEKATADIKAGLDQANAGINQMNAGISKMNQATNDMNSAMDQINGGIVQMNQGIKQIDEAVNGANGIINQTLLGFNDMNEALQQMNQAMSEMNDALDQMIIDLSDFNFDFTFNFSDLNIPEINIDIPEININIPKIDIDTSDLDAARKIIHNMDLNFNAHNFSGFKFNDMDIDFDFPSGYYDPELDERMVSFFEWYPVLGQGFALAELANNHGSAYERFVLVLSVVGGGEGKAVGKGSVKLTKEAKKEVKELVTATKRQNKQRSIFEKYTGYAAKGDVHHGLPEQFSQWFKEHGINVNDPKYYYDLPHGLHKLKVDNGIHTNNSPLGKNWNRIWKEWIADHPKATAQQIEDKLNSMVEGAGMKPYQAKPKK